MIVLYLLLYLFIGFMWLVMVHNQILFNNMLQPLALITFWPIHMITYLIKLLF